jgi:hypothetical protein
VARSVLRSIWCRARSVSCYGWCLGCCCVAAQARLGLPGGKSIPTKAPKEATTKHSLRRPLFVIHNTMATQSRASSRRRRLAPQDDTDSLTSFPDPAPGSPPGSPTTAHAPTMAEHLNGLLDRSEPTMFDERPAVNADDPRALSAANSAVLQGVLDHHGAINLVKRLSESLAERDAHITALQRLCEEYKVPSDRVADAASRVRQAERRRLSLSAASEDLAPSRGTQSESSVSCQNISPFPVPCTDDCCRHSIAHPNR